MRMHIDTEAWAYKVPFRGARGAESALDVVVVTLTDADGRVGRGEAAGVDYDGETIALLRAQIEAVRPAIERGIGAGGGRAALDFTSLATLLPAGGARHARDCALLGFSAQESPASAWPFAGGGGPPPLP